MDFYSQVAHNKRMTFVLFLMFFLLIGFLSFIFSIILDIYYGSGFILFFSIFGIITILFSIISYYTSDKIVTRITGAREAPKQEFKQLYNIVEELCLSSGLPLPKIFVIKDPAINAFATGRNPDHAVICFTTGCIEKLNREQLQGVAAHELSHIKNYDVRTMTLATILVGITVLLSDLLLRMFIFGSIRNSRGSRGSSSGGIIIVAIIVSIILAILTPVVAKMITFAISRKREFMADASAVEMTRNPLGLASALEKISKDSNRLISANKATAHLYISNPLKGQKIFLSNLFSTHPPIVDRINALKGVKN